MTSSDTIIKTKYTIVSFLPSFSGTDEEGFGRGRGREPKGRREREREREKERRGALGVRGDL